MPSQPRPRETRVDTFVGPDGEPFSFITRIWRKKDAKACALCPRCNRKSLSLMSLCAVVTPGFISDEDAPTHRFEEGDLLPDTTVEVRHVEVEEEDDEEDWG